MCRKFAKFEYHSNCTKKSARHHICPSLNVWVKSQLLSADPKKWLSTFDTLRRIIFFEPFMWQFVGRSIKGDISGGQTQDINYLYDHSKDQPLNWKSLNKVNGFSSIFVYFSSQINLDGVVVKQFLNISIHLLLSKYFRPVKF